MKIEIREFRKHLGITQAELAELLREIPLSKLKLRLKDVRTIDVSQVARWESGNRNPDGLIVQAFKYLGCLENNKK